MSSWHSYPKIYNLGHAALKELLNGEVCIEEKVDGSQFSFGMHDGKLCVRSKGRQFEPEGADDMFRLAVERVEAIADKLQPGWTYRGEYLRKPKHNALAYDRTPANNIMIFDVETQESGFLGPAEKTLETERLKFDAIPVLFYGSGAMVTPEMLTNFMSRTSVLGGPKAEGVVIKNYTRYTPDGKVMMGKHVSEAFKEVHRSEWKSGNPSKGDVVQIMIERYRSEARWAKAVQHMAEDGRLTRTPKDIGQLMKEVSCDIKQECEEEIKEELFKWIWKHISRRSGAGLAEWYKQRLLEDQFHPESGIGDIRTCVSVEDGAPEEGENQ